MKTPYKILSGSLIFIGIATGCKTPEIASGRELRPLPETFDDSRDTVSIGSQNWKTFYTDPKLIALIDTALVRNPDVLIAMQRIKAAQSDVLLAKGSMSPNVSAGAAAGLSKFGQYTMDGAGNAGTEIYNGRNIPKELPDYFVGLQTSWEVDVFGKLRNQKRAALARAMSSQAVKHAVVTNLIAEISNQYYELIALDESVKIINRNIALQEKALQLSRVMKQAALGNELAVKQFEAQVANVKALRIDLQQQIVESENRINVLLGDFPKTIARDSIFLNGELPLVLQSGLPSAWLRNRPDVASAQMELLASKADVKAAEAGFYPTLNITGSLGYQGFRTDLLFRPESIAYNILGGLTAPLLNRSAIRANFNRANAAQVEAMYRYQKAILDGYAEVNTEMARVKNLNELAQLKQSEARLLGEAIGISTSLFRFNRANYLEVLTVQQNALQADLDVIEVQKQQRQTVVNLYKALGGGWK